MPAHQSWALACLVLTAVCALSSGAVLDTGGALSCSCSNASWCAPVTTPPAAKELFAFHTAHHGDVWRQFDWTLVTTVCVYGRIDPDLVCFAHSLGKRVTFAVGIPTSELTNASAIAVWATAAATRSQQTMTDGVNVDFENAVNASSPAATGLTTAVRALAAAVRQHNPHAQITFDSGIRPGYEGRDYQYLELAKTIDFFFLMGYDLNDYNDPPPDYDGSLANAPVYDVARGVKEFLALGVSATQLVLGVPWYAYQYLCIPWVHPPCSNFAVAFATEIPFNETMYLLQHNSTTGMEWNATSMSPYFNYEWGGLTFQVWYDDVRSLTAKYNLAKLHNLHGIGMWTADKLNYTAGGDNQTKAMWQAMRPFFAG